MPSEGNPVDLAIVGAGPCGLAAASAARVGGVSAIVFDRGFITESIVHYPPYMTFFSTAEKLEIEDVPFILASGKPSRRDALVYYRRVVRHYALDVRQHEEVTAIEGRRGDFALRTRRRDGTCAKHRARAVVIATGSFHEPNYLDVPGEDLPKVHHYYREPIPTTTRTFSWWAGATPRWRPPWSSSGRMRGLPWSTSSTASTMA